MKYTIRFGFADHRAETDTLDAAVRLADALEFKGWSHIRVTDQEGNTVAWKRL